ncbi:hypothetical protein [Rhizorhabdus wittichii]|uniref:hypothetical protein n=1 Tax=Rhizorhabdus wittichii TaxID=160791 RepID=UPI001ABEFAE7|nr:hypothetical protein [Rhizorhabdus wittichii]
MRVNAFDNEAGGIFLPNLFQFGYATRDMDGAKRAIETRFGARIWQYSPVLEAAPGVTMRDAKTWVGDIMIQIQQVTRTEASTAEQTFWETPAPEPGQLLRLHHIAHMLYDDAEWDHVLKESERHDFPILFQGQHEDILKYLYLDTRPIFGHYLEYILCLPAGHAFFNESRKISAA